MDSKHSNVQSNWILCPSKSFPGKYFYFNVSNGESVWSLNESDKASFGNHHTNNVKLEQESHSFLEPMSPPLDRIINRTNPYLKQTWPHYPMPIFGANAFPNIPYHGPNEWGMFPNQSVYFTPMIPTPTNHYLNPNIVNRNTQTLLSDEIPIKVQSTNVPLTKRFNNQIKTDIKSKPEVTNETEPVKRRKLISCSDNLNNLLSDKKNNNDNMSARKNQGHDNIKSVQTINRKQEINKIGIANQTMPQNYLQSKATDAGNYQENIISNDLVDSKLANPFVNLQNNDLRLLLLAKRMQPGAAKSRTITKSDQAQPMVEKVKKVTFHLDNLSLNNCNSNQHRNINNNPETSLSNSSISTQPYNINYLRNLASKNVALDFWFIVVDVQVLMDEFKLIETVVKKDPKCRLFLPHIVRKQLTAICKGDQNGHKSVIVGRQTMRRVAMCRDIIVDQEVEFMVSPGDSVISCCKEIIDDNYHVVLVTNSVVLKNIAKSINLPCFTIQEIKELVQNTNRATFGNENNAGNKVEKPYMIWESELATINGSFCKNTVPYDETKAKCLEHIKSCFNEILSDQNNMDKIETTKLRNAQTSPIVFNQNSNMDKFKQESQIDGTKQRSNEETGKSNDISTDIYWGEDRQTSPISSTEDYTNFWHITTNDEDVVKNIDERLRMFCNQTVVPKHRWEKQKEEWICMYTQIMEDVLTSVVMRHQETDHNLPPPWALPEAIGCMKRCFKDDIHIKITADKMLNMLFNFTEKYDLLKIDIDFGNFMKVFACGLFLIQYLKERIQDNKDLLKAEEILNNLHNAIKNPSTDPNLSVFDLKVIPCDGYESEGNDLDEHRGIMNKKSDVIEYLRKHYPVWQNYYTANNLLDKCSNSENPSQGIIGNADDRIKVVRTFGRDLKNLKITNTKNMSMYNHYVQGDIDYHNNYSIQQKSSKSNPQERAIKIVENININSNFDENLENSEPNFNNVLLDNHHFDHTNNEEETIFNVEHQMEHRNIFTAVKSMNVANFHNPNSDSGYTDESVHAHSLIKTFLSEIRGTFQLIYKFIRSTSKEFDTGAISKVKKQKHYRKAVKIHKQIVDIQIILKSILERESTESAYTLKALLTKAGSQSDDVRIVRYRQVITKCLEQAEILQKSLRALVTMISGVFDISHLDGAPAPNIKYYNIFED